MDQDTELHSGREREGRPPYCTMNIVDISTGDITTIALAQEDVQAVISGHRPDILSRKDLHRLTRIEEEAFTPLTEWYMSVDEFKQILADMKGPQFLMREQKNGRIVGYLHTEPAVDTYRSFSRNGLLGQDPDLQLDPYALYLESIAGNIGNIGTAQKIIKVLLDQAQQYGYRTLCCHGINPRLNSVLKRMLGFREVRRLAHWLDTTAVYMERDVGNHAETHLE